MPSLVHDPKRPSHKKKYRARVRFHWHEYVLGRYDTYEEAKAAEDA